VVLCGGGNNGGDGYVIARHLHIAGVTVEVYAASDPTRLSGDALTNRKIIERMPLAHYNILTERQLAAASADWNRAHIVVDALLGTDFTGEVRPQLAAVIERCNELTRPLVVAIDLPSGLDCDTGRPSNATIRAHWTLTFVAMKQGFKFKRAKEYAGKILVCGIGAPTKYKSSKV